MIKELLQKETRTAVDAALAPVLAQIALNWNGILPIAQRDGLLRQREFLEGTNYLAPAVADDLGESLLELAVNRGHLKIVSGPGCPRVYELSGTGHLLANSHPLILARNLAMKK